MATALAGFGSRIGRRARAWARRRQGIDDPTTTLHGGRIYILPTRAGIIFALILFTMLLGAMNYNNNLGFALTFLLAGLGIVSMHHCHHNLAGLSLRSLGARPVFAGEPLKFSFVLDNASNQPRWQLRLGWDGADPRVAEIEAGGRQTLQLSLPTSGRGRVSAPRVQLSTLYPLGLLRAWAWINLDLSGLAYPAPAAVATGVDIGEAGQNDHGRSPSGDDDYSGMRAWRTGDPPRRIAWKALARTGQKLVSEYEGGNPAPLWIDWDTESVADAEQRIARLARRVLDADVSGRVYGLRLPGLEIPPNRGAVQLHACLEQLALMPGPARAGEPA